VEGIGKSDQHHGMDQVYEVDIGGQAFRHPPSMFPALTEEHQQAKTHAHDHERFPERVAKRKPVETTCYGKASLSRSCCPPPLSSSSRETPNLQSSLILVWDLPDCR
jgi:hypothetical protein